LMVRHDNLDGRRGKGFSVGVHHLERRLSNRELHLFWLSRTFGEAPGGGRYDLE